MKIKTRKIKTAAGRKKLAAKSKTHRRPLKGWPKELSRLMEVRPFDGLKEGLARALTRI